MNTTSNPLTVIMRIIFGLLFLGFIYIVWPYVSSVVVMLIFAFLFTTIMLKSTDYLERKIRNRGLSVVIISGTIVAVISIFFIGFASGFMEQVQDFSKRLNEENTVETMNTTLHTFVASLPDFVHDAIPQNTNFVDSIKSNIGQLLEGLVAFAGAIGSFIFTSVMVIIFTIILLHEYYNFKRSIASLFPNRYFEIGLRLMYNMEKQVSNYLHGQLLAAGSVALLSIIGLFILNLFGANLTLIVFIGIIAGLANLIPLVGPFVGMIPAILIAFMNNLGNEAAAAHVLLGVIPSPFFILDIIVMFIIVQQIDNNFVTPILVGESVGLHPMMVMIALLIGGTLLGPLGMLFAVPAAGILKVVLQEIRFVSKNAHLL